MPLTSLAVRNCRNLVAVDVTLTPGLNLFIGPNGAGKTALLEAVHLLARGRSFRVAQANKIIRYEQAEMIVRATNFDHFETERVFAVSRPRRGPMVVHVDGEKAPGISTISQQVPVQVMLPGVSDLVFGGPAERRRWLDWGVFHVKHAYLTSWRRYNKLLKQRNAQLKLETDPGSSVLTAFTESLVEAAEPLFEDCEQYLLRWLDWFKQALLSLDPSLGDIVVSWAPNGSATPMNMGHGGSFYTHQFEDILSVNRLRDVKSGSTHGGPHRLELHFLLHGRPAAERLSRGQGKTLALAMKISQAQMLTSESGQKSLFLIDDAGAELDKQHNAAFFETMASTEAQVLATCNEEPWTGSAYSGTNRSLFHVKQGQIDAR